MYRYHKKLEVCFGFNVASFISSSFQSFLQNGRLTRGIIFQFDGPKLLDKGMGYDHVDRMPKISNKQPSIYLTTSYA